MCHHGASCTGVIWRSWWWKYVLICTFIISFYYNSKFKGGRTGGHIHTLSEYRENIITNSLPEYILYESTTLQKVWRSSIDHNFNVTWYNGSMHNLIPPSGCSNGSSFKFKFQPWKHREPRVYPQQAQEKHNGCFYHIFSRKWRFVWARIYAGFSWVMK